MKKTYIIPEALIVQLGICKMMAVSNPRVTVDSDPNEDIDAENVEVKVISDTKLWDDLW